MNTDALPSLPEYKDRLKFARKKAKLSQLALADRVGVSQAIISRLETGEDTKSAFTAQFANVCRVPASWLATGSVTEKWSKITEIPIEHTSLLANNQLPTIKEWSEIIRSRGEVMFRYVYEGNLMTGQSGQAIPSGSIIFVDPSITPAPGKSVVLAASDGKPVIGTYTLLHKAPHAVPSNTRDPAIRIDDDAVIGVVTKFEVSIA